MAQHAKGKEATYDGQRRHIEKLMQNPHKPVELPQPSQTHKLHEPPDFVRNVMGSSAGAGSGEFHVYRHLRRAEAARMKAIEQSAVSEKLDQEYKQQLAEFKRKAEERTAKKRLKREKKKKKSKNKPPTTDE